MKNIPRLLRLLEWAHTKSRAILCRMEQDDGGPRRNAAREDMPAETGPAAVPIPGRILVTVEVEAFSLPEWSPLTRLFPGTWPQGVYLGSPGFWLRLLGGARKHRLQIFTESDRKGVVQSHIVLDGQNNDSWSACNG